MISIFIELRLSIFGPGLDLIHCNALLRFLFFVVVTDTLFSLYKSRT